MGRRGTGVGKRGKGEIKDVGRHVTHVARLM